MDWELREAGKMNLASSPTKLGLATGPKFIAPNGLRSLRRLDSTRNPNFQSAYEFSARTMPMFRCCT